MALILARHTRPAVAGTCYGRSDAALAPSFAAEAEALLAELPEIARIATSPLARCRRLADALGDRLGLPVAADPDLAEMDFGAWEGRPWDAIPAAELDAWAADLLGARPHGGESVAMLLARTRRALARLRGAPGAGLAITHAGVIRAALFDAGDPGAWQREIPFARAIRL
jgi:alpha-ribazole phosphatase